VPDGRGSGAPAACAEKNEKWFFTGRMPSQHG
jgi:hypothetical protein